MTHFGSPHVDAARRSRSAALPVGVVFAVIGLLLRSAVEVNLAADWPAGIVIPAAVGYLAASLFVAAAGLISAGIVAEARSRTSGTAERSSSMAPAAADGAR